MDAIQQTAKRLPQPAFWQPDTRSITVQCATCRNFHTVFVYPLFNWIPPVRLTTEMALLNVLIAMMVWGAAVPHQPLLALLTQ